MRNAAYLLGLTGGLMGLCVGFFAYAFTEVMSTYGDVTQVFHDPQLVRVMSVLSPLMALAGAGMAKYRALWGGILMLAAAAGMYLAFGTTIFTLFPMGFSAVAGVMALAAGRPDVEKSHF